MADAAIEVSYPREPRNRMTTGFRLILAIPHLVISGAWGKFNNVLSVVQWFIVLFTGKRNEGIFGLQNAYVGYSSRVSAYVALLIDEYPPFGTDPGQTGVTFQLAYEADADRLSNALRLLYVIPAVVIAFFVAIGAGVLLVISWFAIVFTGNQPRGMFDFIRRSFIFSVKISTYANLMTDTYPKFV